RSRGFCGGCAPARSQERAAQAVYAQGAAGRRLRVTHGRRVIRAVALRYALAPACVLLVVLVHLSPAQGALPIGGLLVLAVLGAAWFGGAGPGLLAALLATLALSQFLSVSYPLVGGVLDLPRFVTFSVAGLA